MSSVWNITVETNTSLSDPQAITAKSIPATNFIINVFLTRNDFRHLFEDTQTSVDGTEMNKDSMNVRLKAFFEEKVGQTNNKSLASDLYRLLVTNFTDLDVSMPLLNDACASNDGGGQIFKYFVENTSTSKNDDNSDMSVFQAITEQLDLMIKRDDSSDPYHYSNFWENSKVGNSIIIEGSILTPSQQSVNVSDYNHPDNGGKPSGWIPCSLNFQHSQYSYSYVASDNGTGKREGVDPYQSPQGSLQAPEGYSDFLTNVQSAADVTQIADKKGFSDAELQKIKDGNMELDEVDDKFQA